MLNGKPFENLFRYAADDVARQTRHPGQSIPGVWDLGGNQPPNVIVVAIVAAALARIAAEHEVSFQALLAHYTDVAGHVPFRAVGAPDSIAIAHLKDCSRYAADLRTQVSAEERLSRADPQG
jgi:hypothetical protein